MQSKNRDMNSRRVIIVALLLLSISGTAAAVDVVGRPDIEVIASDNRVTPGETTELDIFLNNAGRLFHGGPSSAEERVKTARGLTLELGQGDAPIEVLSSRRAVGTVTEGVHGPIRYRLSVDEDAEPGTYTLPIVMEYRYTAVVEDADSDSPRYSSYTRRVRRQVTLVVEDNARFEVVGVESNVSVGGSGELTLRLKNTGSESVRDARVSVSSSSNDVRFGNTSGSERFIGGWSAGETQEVNYRIGLSRDASTNNLPLQLTVTYVDMDGDEGSSDTLVFGLSPRMDRRYDFDVSGRLHAGEQDSLTGTVTNTGDIWVNRSRVVLLEGALSPGDRENAVGDLGPNESSRFRFTVDAPNASGAVVASFVVEYRDRDGELWRSNVHDVVVDVVGSRAFGVETLNRSFTVGQTSTLTVIVENRLDSVVRDVTVGLGVQEPLSSEDSNAFVRRLEPNETARLDFELEVGGDAVPKLHPATLNIRYRTPEGEIRSSTGYVVGVDVEEEGADLPILPLALILVVIAGGYVWWRYRT